MHPGERLKEGEDHTVETFPRTQQPQRPHNPKRSEQAEEGEMEIEERRREEQLERSNRSQRAVQRVPRVAPVAVPAQRGYLDRHLEDEAEREHGGAQFDGAGVRMGHRGVGEAHEQHVEGDEHRAHGVKRPGENQLTAQGGEGRGGR